MKSEEDTTASTGPQGPYQPIVPESNDTTPIAEGTADDPDDALLQSASSDMGEEVGVPPPAEFKPKSGKGKKVFFLLFLLALIAGGAAAYYFLVYKKATPAQPAASAPAQETALTYEPDTIPYAFQTKSSAPRTIYTRPATGGDRVEATLNSTDGGEPKPFTVSAKAGIEGITSGQSVAILADDILYISKDAGKSYSQVYELKGGQTITSMKFSTDSSKLAFALLDNSTSKNTVSSIDLDGQNKTELFVSPKAAILITGWDQAAQKIVYQSATKYGSDGNYENLQLLEIESGKTTQLLEDVADDELASIAISNDLTKLVYVTMTADQAIKVESLTGYYIGPPNTVSVLDIESGESEKVATLGKKGDKNPNGTYAYVDTKVGFLINSDTPYYISKEGVVEKVLVPQGADSEADSIFESAMPIEQVLYANEAQAIVYSGADANDSALINNTNGGESITILEGDSNTTLFGATTK